MVHGSLFSGLGGFDLAAQWMGWTNTFHCEWNPYCQKILKQHFPNADAYGDITRFDASAYQGRVDIISGGFPCQPFSVAGKRKGAEDDRYLWPQMLRIINQVQPRWVVGENVSGLISQQDGVVFEQVLSDLEDEGYTVWPVVLPACAVGAPHRRDRVWIIAHTDSGSDWNIKGHNRKADGLPQINRAEIRSGEPFGANTGATPNTNRQSVEPEIRRERPFSFSEGGTLRNFIGSDGELWATPNAANEGVVRRDGEPGNDGIGGSARGVQSRNSYRYDGDEINRTDAHPSGSGWEELNTPALAARAGHRTGGHPSDWSDWPAEPPVCRRDDGVPARLERIKALGNAIVPQVAYQIFKTIQQIEDTL